MANLGSCGIDRASNHEPYACLFRVCPYQPVRHGLKSQSLTKTQEARWERHGPGPICAVQHHGLQYTNERSDSVVKCAWLASCITT